MKGLFQNTGAAIVGGSFGCRPMRDGATCGSTVENPYDFPYANRVRKAIEWLGDRYVLAHPQPRPRRQTPRYSAGVVIGPNGEPHPFTRPYVIYANPPTEFDEPYY